MKHFFTEHKRVLTLLALIPAYLLYICGSFYLVYYSFERSGTWIGITVFIAIMVFNKRVSSKIIQPLKQLLTQQV